MKDRKWTLWIGVAMVLFATALRFYRLDAQSFWNDEGNSARLVERPVALILRGTAADIHPPGYYLLLHGWRALAGDSEFALRGFSALCGVLTVAVAASLGRRAGGWRVAGAAAGLTAAHPLLVYYSQEARMYALLALLAALTWGAMVWLMRSPSRRAVAVLTGSIALGLYTQYTYLFALLALDLAFGGWWLVRRRGDWALAGWWLAAHGIAGALFLPWLPVAMHALGWRPPDLTEAHALRDMSAALIAGITLPAEQLRYGRWLLGTGIVLGGISRPRSFVAWSALSMAVIPALLIAALDVYRPAYLKFLVVSVVPLSVWLALPWREVAGRRRVLAGLVGLTLAGLLVLQGRSLRHLYDDPAYARDDYRGIAARLHAITHPDDAVLLSAPNQWEVFTYYYHGPAPVLPAPYRPTEAQARQWVTDALRGHRRLFVLFWGDGESDPQRLVEPLLAQMAYPAQQSWIGDVRLAVYGVGPRPLTPTVPLSVTLGEAITLRGVALPAETYHGGEIIPLTLFWAARAAPAQRYKVFVHLLDAQGALAAQYDAEPQGGFALTNRWAAGEQVLDRCGVWLPADIPAGRYTLRVGMYDLSGQRLPCRGPGVAGDGLTVAELLVK